jgi:hypothetical protein
MMQLPNKRSHKPITLLALAASMTLYAQSGPAVSASFTAEGPTADREAVADRSRRTSHGS